LFAPVQADKVESWYLPSSLSSLALFDKRTFSGFVPVLLAWPRIDYVPNALLLFVVALARGAGLFAPTITVVNGHRSAPINGLMMSGCPISSSGSPAKLAAPRALTSARTSIGNARRAKRRAGRNLEPAAAELLRVVLLSLTGPRWLLAWLCVVLARSRQHSP